MVLASEPPLPVTFLSSIYPATSFKTKIILIPILRELQLLLSEKILRTVIELDHGLLQPWLHNILCMALIPASRPVCWAPVRPTGLTHIGLTPCGAGVAAFNCSPALPAGCFLASLPEQEESAYIFLFLPAESGLALVKGRHTIYLR